jgi:hypothetical protein
MLDGTPWFQFNGLVLETPLLFSTRCRPFAHHLEAEWVDRSHFNYTNEIKQLRSLDAILRHGLCITIAAHTTLVDPIQ